jgi:nitric oxide reductase activation protein
MIAEGERMGTVLANQLQIMAEETPLTYTRLSHGRIDKRRLAGLGYEQEDVFAQTFIERHDPVLVHLTIDSSGSMAGLKWKQSIKLAAALAKAAEVTPTMDVVISFRASSNATDIVQVLIAYDSRVDTFSKIKQLFPYILPTGGTPEGLAFEAIKSVIIESHSTTRRFFVNISDGQPDYHPPDRSFDYSGAKAWDHTRQQVQAFREAGIHILSYFVEDKLKQVSRLKTLLDPKKYATRTNDGFNRMYGPDAAIIDVDNVTAIAQTLNRLFLA